jgi:hypothetical protein
VEQRERRCDGLELPLAHALRIDERVGETACEGDVAARLCASDAAHEQLVPERGVAVRSDRALDIARTRELLAFGGIEARLEQLGDVA